MEFEVEKIYTPNAILFAMRKASWGTVITINGKSTTYEARYSYKGQRICKRFKDELSAQGWLNSEKTLVEADKKGISKWTTPSERKRQEDTMNRRKRLFCDYVMEDFAPTWLEYTSDGRELELGSKRKHREYLAHLSHAFFWKYPINEITTEDINRWLGDMDNFNGAYPRKRTFQLMKAVMRKAFNEGVIDRSPVTMKAPALPPSKRAEIPPATAEELQIIFEHMPEWTKLAIWLGAILDLRTGEVVALQVQDWNPKAQTLTVRHGIDEKNQLKGAKSAASHAVQPVPPKLAELIEQACNGKKPTDRIIHSKYGDTISENSLRDHFNKAKQYANRPDLVFHTFRATSITAAANQGVTLKETMQWGRHADAKTSIERYQRASGHKRMRQIAEGIENELMGREPTVEELEREIAQTEKRLTQLKAELAAIHQKR